MPNKALQYALFGTGAAVVVYFVARKLSASAEPPRPTPASSATQILQGIRDLYGAIKRGTPSTGVTPTGDTPVSVVPVASADGDSAISNSSGLDKATSYTTTPTTPSYKDRATIGVVNYSHFGVAQPPAVVGSPTVKRSFS